VKALCGSGGFLYPCQEAPTVDRNPVVEFGPFGLPVAPEIADEMLPFVGPSEQMTPTDDSAEDVPVWDVNGFSEFLTEYKAKTAAKDELEPRGKASPLLWWILGAIAALILWKA